MSTLLKKLTLSFLVSLVVLFSLSNFFEVKAAATSTDTSATWYNAPFNDWYGKVYDPNNPSEIFGERYTAAQVQWVIYGFFGFLINTTTGPQNAGIVQCFLNSAVDISACTSLLQKLIDNSKVNDVVPATRTQNQNLWDLVFADRPLSGVSYIRDKIQNFSIIPVAQAAPVVGFGFNALQPIQGMWRAFRDIAFGLFVIVAVVFAFMIMFRVKLSPQTVISVQSALPKIVVALILVTFSYAIAGLLVDLMYVVIGLLSLVASQIFSVSVGIVGLGPSQYFNFLTLGQPFGINIQVGVFGLIDVFFVTFFLSLFILLMVSAAPLLVVPGINLITFLFLAILYVVAVFVALWTGVKVIWSLLKAFVNIILLTIFAPIQIALGTVIPSLGFSQWLKSYVSNLAVFVVTGALFLFSFLFIIEGVVTAFSGSLLANVATAILNPLLGTHIATLPPFGNGAWPPLLGTGNAGWVGLLFLGVAFVLFTLTPKAAEIIQGLLSGKPFAYGTAVGEAVGSVVTLGKVGIGAAIGISEEQRQKIARTSNPPIQYEPRWTTKTWEMLTGRH